MQKTLKLLWGFAFFVLFVGWAVTSLHAHPCDREPGHKHCNGEPPPPDSGEPAEYSVEITGAVSGHSFDNWRTQSAHGIGWSDPHGLAGEFTNLSFFEDHFNGLQVDTGSNCFRDVEWLYGNFKQRKGSAGGSFWINGWTVDGITPVVYLLHVFGDPDGSNWPRPSIIGVPISFDMTGWEMGITNGQSDLFNISCIDEGLFDVGDPMIIEVTREN